jgi:N-acetylmuramoyl-L-alanine amidase
MARLVHAETRGEPYQGQVAVAAVLLNRIENSAFPDSIYDAVYQPMQFEPVDNGAINFTPNNKAYEAVFDALKGQDPTEGALFFWNPDKVSKTSWVWTRKITSRIGRHVFGI